MSLVQPCGLLKKKSWWNCEPESKLGLDPTHLHLSESESGSEQDQDYLHSHFQSYGAKKIGVTTEIDQNRSEPEILRFMDAVQDYSKGGIYSWSPPDQKWKKGP